MFLLNIHFVFVLAEFIVHSCLYPSASWKQGNSSAAFQIQEVIFPVLLQPPLTQLLILLCLISITDIMQTFYVSFNEHVIFYK